MKSLSWNLWGFLVIYQLFESMGSDPWGETNPFVETPQKIETTITLWLFVA